MARIIPKAALAWRAVGDIAAWPHAGTSGWLGTIKLIAASAGAACAGAVFCCQFLRKRVATERPVPALPAPCQGRLGPRSQIRKLTSLQQPNPTPFSMSLAMNPVALGESDLRVTPICLGTMTFG